MYHSLLLHTNADDGVLKIDLSVIFVGAAQCAIPGST